MITIDVVSDVICPWCYVGKRRLEKALQSLTRGLAVQVHWLPFELNPDMPKEGIDRRTYRTLKFGSWEQSQALDARLLVVGRQEGIAFDLMERTPNTFDSHRLIRIAQQEGRQDQIVEALFRGYFIEGKNVGDRQTLLTIAEENGLDRSKVEGLLAGGLIAAEVRAEEEQARRHAVSGVPFFTINGRWEAGISGAQPAEVLRSALEMAAMRV